MTYIPSDSHTTSRLAEWKDMSRLREGKRNPSPLDMSEQACIRGQNLWKVHDHTQTQQQLSSLGHPCKSSLDCEALSQASKGLHERDERGSAQTPKEKPTVDEVG